MISFPRVRALEPVQIPPNGDSHLPRFLLKDPACLSEEQLIVSLVGLYLIEFADGTRDAQAILESLKEKIEISADVSAVNSLLEALDKQYLLDNERARLRLAEINPRPVLHGSAGYPPGSLELDNLVDDLLNLKPGMEGVEGFNFPRASVLPHIDFFRGREAYQAGYRHLHGLKNATTVVILGISHAYCRTPFILTRKDFATPYGLAQTDQSLVDELCRDLPFDPFLDEYNHIGEHSVEFHAVLLKRLAPSLKIVPVLCRSFHQAVRDHHSPLILPGVEPFLKNLGRIRDTHPGVHFLASVDLAHMGLNFGGSRLSRAFLEELKERDQESLKALERGDADAFFATHQQDQGERNYCGTPAIYSLLHLFPRLFHLLCYRQCSDPDLGSTVTIASAISKE